MHVDLTVPISTEDGFCITEFEAYIFIKILYPGKPWSYWSPPEPPEWEIEEYNVEAKHFDKETKITGSKHVTCPEALKPYIDAYADSDAGYDAIITAIQEADREVA